MPWNGSGLITRLYSWIADDNAGIDITASRMDADTNDIVTCIENTVTLDGQTIPVHSLPMGGFTHTGVGNATARTNYAAAGQIVDGSLLWGGTSGGSANAQTITITPTVTALVAGQAFRFLAGFTNSAAVTLTVNATAATALRKIVNGSLAALVGGEIRVGGIYVVVFDGTFYQLQSTTSGAPSIIGFSTGVNSVTAGSTWFFSVGNLASVAAQVFFTAPMPGTMTNLYVQASAAPGAAQTYTYAMVQNGTAGAMTCAISGNAQSAANDTAHPLTVATGDTFTLRLITSAGAAVVNHSASMRFDSI